LKTTDYKQRQNISLETKLSRSRCTLVWCDILNAFHFRGLYAFVTQTEKRRAHV